MARRGGDRPTLKTIAELTGLSLSTVSLSLRDGSTLKQSTRDRVAAAAREVGYVPNRAGVRLRTGQTNVLALLLSSEDNTVDYTRRLIEGIGAHINGTRYHLSVIPETDLDDPLASVRYVMENQTADGVMLTHTSARDPRIQLLTDADFPFVSHGRSEFYTPHAYHDFHSERFVDMAIERMLEKGRSKFLLAAVDNSTTNYANILGQFNRTTAEAGVMADRIKASQQLGSAQGARAIALELGDRPDSFDAIICSNELTALSIISGLAEKGLQLGRDYDLICKQLSEILPTVHPHMDTVAEDLLSSGRELAKLLIDRINGTEISALQSLHEPIPMWRS